MDRLAKEKVKLYYLGVRPWTRHSLVLVVAGLVYVGIGLAFFRVPELTEKEYRTIEVALRFMPLHGWGMVFLGTGLSAILSARWPPTAEKWGYSALTGLSSGWAAVYALSYIFGDAPINNLTSTLVWSLMAFLWWAISGLLNPSSAVRHGSG